MPDAFRYLVFIPNVPFLKIEADYQRSSYEAWIFQRTGTMETI